MKRIQSIFLVVCIFFAILSIGCAPRAVTLWNGKNFDGWTRVVADNTNVDGVWSVTDGVIHCIGVPNGYMRTDADYENYILNLEWRWVGTGTNSGVFLHVEGPDKVWPNCFECQLKSGNAGDFVIIGAGILTVDGKRYDNAEGFMGIAKKQENSERPVGEWNSYRIECRGGSITSYVNGVLQNEATNASRTSGKIALQSEGGPIEYRNIRLEKIK